MLWMDEKYSLIFETMLGISLNQIKVQHKSIEQMSRSEIQETHMEVWTNVYFGSIYEPEESTDESSQQWLFTSIFKPKLRTKENL